MGELRPFGIVRAARYALRAAIAHYRFARRREFREGVSLVCPVQPTFDRMNLVGCRWSDWSRMCGDQPVDPAVIWDDVATLWAAYHTKSSEPSHVR